MSTAKSAIEVSDPGITPEEVTVEIRGQRYTFRELEISEYNKLVKQASHEEADADGIMQEVVDNGVLMLLMIRRSCISPVMTPDQVAALPTRAQRAISGIVNTLHFGVEPIVQIGKDGTAEKETPKGND